MWFLVESLFFINLFCLIIPLTRKQKKVITLYIFTVVTGCLFFYFLSGLKINSFLFFNDLFTKEFNFYFFQNVIFTLDELTNMFCLLTTILFLLILAVTYKSPNFNSPNFFLLVWLLNFSLFHTFSSTNLLAFYFFFELTLLPMFMLILFWGSRQRRIHAAYLFFYFTAFGSLLLLIGILCIYSVTNTFTTYNLSYLNIPITIQKSIFLLFFLGFATKVPVVPLHTWLPEAHVEAPTVGSIILAGLLLKIGTFGMLRFIFPFLIDSLSIFRPFIFFLAILSIYHASFIALRQFDFKKLIAYSSIAHMGFVLLGLFSANIYGFAGSVFIMISHGIVASALFFLIGVIYERYHSKNILQYGGLASLMPLYATFLFLFILANISFPGTSNFIGEALVLFSTTQRNLYVVIFATFSIILTAAYSIWSYNRTCFGQLNPSLYGFSDLNKLEFHVLLIFLILCILMGIFPNCILGHLDIISFFYTNN